VSIHKTKGILSVFALSLFLTACGSSPKNTVEEFYRAAEKGEVSKMIALINMENPQMQMLGAKIKVALEQSSKEISSSGIQDLQINCDEKAEYATCKVNMTLKNAQKPNKEDTVNLEKSKEGKWLIQFGGLGKSGF
jgi:hypothetical protein